MPPLTFGKFKGVDVASVDSGYLKWLLDQDWFQDQYPELYEAVEVDYQMRERSHGHFWDD